MTRTQRARGFTLVELLIATALFSIIMAAIVTLFVASLHAVKSAYLASDAYETSRGAFAVVERDLTTVFTMRDYGDYYQFYGTPQGMSMIGLVRDPDGGSTTLGRITYVIYPVVIKDTAGDFYVTGPFNLPQLNTRPVPIQFATINNAGTPSDPSDDFEEVQDFLYGTAALLRYVEPGVEDLDTYPFDWNELAVDPEFGTSVKDELDRAIANLAGLPQDSSNPNVLLRLTSSQQEMLAAKKRELWIRMLAGQEYWIPVLNGAAPQLPNVWGMRDSDGSVIQQSWLEPFDINGDVNALDPRDYVVAENIGLVTQASEPHTIPLYPMQRTHPFTDPVRSLYPGDQVASFQTLYNNDVLPFEVVAGNLAVNVYANGALVATNNLLISPAMSLVDLAVDLNDLGGVYAFVNGGTIEVGPELNPDPGGQFAFSFGNDTSGVLRALGLYGQFFRYGRVLATSELDVRSSWNSALNVGTTAN
ncbi:MAG: prepilin-type N-terminal cleavage/methylation domain-containing protein, partial [Candidatus Hydrogenedentes bacterium]|nr:prepilin-type N-terminal cleavage/methylation domain-containing protein [Candidatus Hydrogenedentota bacterium]